MISGQMDPARDHPRIRGEHGDLVGVAGINPGIIPAYAGSTHRSAKVTSR